MRVLVLGAAVLALSAHAASAQAVYAWPGYGSGYGSGWYYAPAPVYPAPPRVLTEPPVVSGYYAPPPVVVSQPYDYAPGYYSWYWGGVLPAYWGRSWHWGGAWLRGAPGHQLWW